MACDSVPVVEAPLRPEDVITWLGPDERFEVEGANNVVHRPGAVHILREEDRGFTGEYPGFRAGDTLYVLDYRSEGRFDVW